MPEDLNAALAHAVLAARKQQGLTVAALAEASGVSRAMISKVERAEVQPTAALLARLTGPLGLTLSELIARAETREVRVVRRREQATWTDPDTGYTRRSLSPTSGSALELVEVSLPAGAEVSYPAEAYHFLDQQVLVLEGRLRITEGPDAHELDPGDCLRFSTPQDTTFANPASTATRYLVALTKRSRPGAP